MLYLNLVWLRYYFGQIPWGYGTRIGGVAFFMVKWNVLRLVFFTNHPTISLLFLYHEYSAQISEFRIFWILSKSLKTKTEFRVAFSNSCSWLFPPHPHPRLPRSSGWMKPCSFLLGFSCPTWHWPKSRETGDVCCAPSPSTSPLPQSSTSDSCLVPSCSPFHIFFKVSLLSAGESVW